MQPCSFCSSGTRPSWDGGDCREGGVVRGGEQDGEREDYRNDQHISEWYSLFNSEILQVSSLGRRSDCIHTETKRLTHSTREVSCSCERLRLHFTQVHVYTHTRLTGIPMKTCTNVLSRELRGTTHSGFSTVKNLQGVMR